MRWRWFPPRPRPILLGPDRAQSRRRRPSRLGVTTPSTRARRGCRCADTDAAPRTLPALHAPPSVVQAAKQDERVQRVETRPWHHGAPALPTRADWAAVRPHPPVAPLHGIGHARNSRIPSRSVTSTAPVAQATALAARATVTLMLGGRPELLHNQ